MQKGARPKKRMVTSSRPESRMEVDEAPRSKGQFNLDRMAQEHMNEGLEVWIPTESTSSLRGLETQTIRPLMDVALPGYTPSSNPSGSQVSGSSSRLKELNERLQLRNRESPARVELPPTWRKQPIRSVVISSYKRNTEGRYHRHNRMDWSTAQRVRRDCFHDAAWVEYLTQPRVPEGAVHLIVGDSLLRVLTRIQSHWQTGILSFAGAATPQMLATLEMLGMARVYTVTLMIGTNDVSRGESRKVMNLHDKMSCILEELRIQMEPAILTVCTIPYNMKADQQATADFKDSSRSSRTRLPGAAPMEAEEATSSTPQSSVVSSVVVVESKRVERCLEKVKELDLEDLECRQELAEALGLERVSHEDLGRHQCVDWLKAHETHFSRAKIMETADLTGIPTKSVMGSINYRPLKLLGSPGLLVEPPKHRTSIARTRLATPAQLRVVDKLLDPREMELPDAAYEGTRLADDPRYGKPCGNTQLAKTLAVYDRADPAATRVVIVAGSDFEGTSPKLFWQETLIYSLPGAELNRMLTFVVAIKSEMPCEPELLLFAGMNDHLHATGFLEQLNGDEQAPKRIWEAIQTLFAAINEVQMNVTSRFCSKTRVVFTTSPGYASMPPALQFVYEVLILIAEGNGWRILMAAPNRELEPTNLRLRKSELAAAWADVSHALRGFYELADILIVLDEVLLLEISSSPDNSSSVRL